jgi:hypothetical protein
MDVTAAETGGWHAAARRFLMRHVKNLFFPLPQKLRQFG